MNSLINVYAPKAERSHATHLNHVSQTVYLLGSQFKLPLGASLLEQMHFLGHVNIKLRCEIQSVWNDWTLAEQEKHSKKAFQSAHRHYLPWIYCSNTHCTMILWQKMWDIHI